MQKDLHFYIEIMYTLMEYRPLTEKLYKVILFAAEIYKFAIYVKSIRGCKS